MKKNNVAIVFAVALILSGCAAQTVPTATKEIPTFANTFEPTVTKTAGPSKTPTKRSTPTKIPTKTPAPRPVIYSGHGDTILDLDDELIGVPRTADISHTGYSNFSIISYGPGNEYIDLLVNVVGDYQGRVPIDFFDNDTITRLEIKADGDWKIKFLPFDCAYQTCVDLPKKYEGAGDDVLLFPWDSPDIAAIDSNGSSNFIVLGFGDQGMDLLVNDIAPYSGQVMFSGDTTVVVVKATGKWTMDITVR